MWGEIGQRKKERRGGNLGREDLGVERGWTGGAWCLTGQRKKVYVYNSDSSFGEDILIYKENTCFEASLLVMRYRLANK